jgi:hypothetical protein
MACSLDDNGLRAQRDRYRLLGQVAESVERSPRRLVIRTAAELDSATVEQLVAVERACCPFFTLDWDPLNGRLAISVASDSDGPALDAIEYALAAPDRG